MNRKKLIIIDNYDSFTYTIKDYFDTLDIHTLVLKNDDEKVNTIEALQPDYIVLSPGPGNPNDAGYTLAVIKKYYKRYPILGVCLGHQCLVQEFGGNIIHATEIVHGKISTIFHNNEGLFANIPNQFNATRYHSLVADENTLPKQFKVTAWTYDAANAKVVMGLQHTLFPLFGVQYHPEAALTEYGHRVFQNFLNYKQTAFLAV